MITAIRTWLRWKRDLRRLEWEAASAYDRWTRARYAYSDTCTVLGAFSVDASKAMDELTDRMEEYRGLVAKAERLREVGP